MTQQYTADYYYTTQGCGLPNQGIQTTVAVSDSAFTPSAARARSTVAYCTTGRQSKLLDPQELAIPVCDAIQRTLFQSPIM